MTEALPARAPIQAKAAGSRAAAVQALLQEPGGAAPETSVHDVAAQGIAGPGGPLPHLDLIQRAFGRHDLGHVRAHVDDGAASAAQEIGAEAYTAGEHVAFDGAPSLHTAAHEAAHVVQQRAGVQLQGGVGRSGDPYEQHADAVADRVVRGESAEALLDEHAGAARGEGDGPASQAAVQRKPSDLRTAFGAHPQLNLSPVKQLQHPSWNAYVLNLRPYLKIDDEDQEKQASWLHLTCSRERSLREDAEGERGKERVKQDPWKIFSPAQLELSARIAELLEQEKSEVFGASIGQLDPTQNVRKFGVKDTEIAHGGKEYVGHEDPAHLLCQLFPQTPAMEDVQQGNLGDCYLLAAVVSVVQRDPDHFVKHMRDNVDGTVTVRFYSAVDTPLQVTVDKTVVGNKYARNVLWVKLLEKAYVASGLKTGQIGDGGKKDYKDISGGASEQALVHLTGHDTSSFALGQGRRKFQLAAPSLAMDAVVDLKRQMREIGDKQDQLQQQIKQKQLGDKDADVTSEKELLAKHQLEFDAVVKEWQSIEAPRQELEDLLSRVYVSEQTFVEFMKRHEGNELLGKIVEKAGLKEGSLPGELGSGVYGQDEEAAFLRIRTAIDAGKPITASTKRSIMDLDNPEEKEKGLAGESKVNGLASAHAYSVLDYKPRPEAYQRGDQIMIKLRNPWGHYGRKYEIVKDKLKGVADNEGDGIFWIDLADLVAYFDDLAMMK